MSVNNLGLVTLNALYLGNSTAGTDLTLHGGDVIDSTIDLRDASVLTVQQTSGIGLTLDGDTLSSFTIDPSSMDLIFNLNTAPNWDFRWVDPAGGGNWIGTLDSMIADGQIMVSAPQGYTIDDRGGYTYVDGLYSVPEPSSLGCLAIAGFAVGMKRRRTKH